jgi:hypothetical protein
MLGALVAQAEPRDTRRLLLWGHPVARSSARALARRFVEVSDRLGERPTAANPTRWCSGPGCSCFARLAFGGEVEILRPV